MPYSTIDSPNKHFDTTTYTANGGSQTITNSGSMQPDFFWGKVRSTTSNNILINSVVGVSKYLYSNTTASEVTDANYFTSFNSNGFSVGSNNYSNGTTMVAWQWKGGGTGVSNTAGTISSTVSANTTSGFSIVSYTGNGTSGSIGHGLSSTPAMIICKSRSDAEEWATYHQSLTYTKYIVLNSTAAAVSTARFYQAPTSSLFYVDNGYGVNKSSATYIAYCFAEVKGFSKAFSYTGNGSTDGTFVYCGFKPAFIMTKNTSQSASWFVYDNKRSTYNPATTVLAPNASDSEADWNTTRPLDILSNGFKLRVDSIYTNTSGNNFIGIAFAENPFVSSKSIPTTAR